MQKKDLIKYWLESAAHDLDVAEALFENAKYDWCLFIGHLVIEKTLKAFWVKNNVESQPPKTHNLVFLAQHSALNLDDVQLKFLQFVNTFNIGTRYPDYKFKIYQMCNKEFTEKNLIKIRDFREWLMKKL